MVVLSPTRGPVLCSQGMYVRKKRDGIATAAGFVHPRPAPRSTDLRVVLHLPMSSH